MDSGIITLIITASMTVVMLCLKLSYSSKCKVIKCGCIEIIRDTDHEQAINIGGTPQQNANVV
jgi:hypothetical protein